MYRDKPIGWCFFYNDLIVVEKEHIVYAGFIYSDTQLVIFNALESSYNAWDNCYTYDPTWDKYIHEITDPLDSPRYEKIRETLLIKAKKYHVFDQVSDFLSSLELIKGSTLNKKTFNYRFNDNVFLKIDNKIYEIYSNEIFNIKLNKLLDFANAWSFS